MKLFLLLFIPALFLGSCKCNTNKSNIEKPINKEQPIEGEPLKKETFKTVKIQTEIPPCVSEKIEAIKNGKVRNPPTVAKELDLDGKKYYLIPSGCCDQFDYIIDENCKTFCSEGYGVRGKFNNGCDTLKNATRKIIWRDTRKRSKN